MGRSRAMINEYKQSERKENKKRKKKSIKLVERCKQNIAYTGIVSL